MLLLKGQSCLQLPSFLSLLLFWLNELDPWVDLTLDLPCLAVGRVPSRCRQRGSSGGPAWLCWCWPGVGLASALPEPAPKQPSCGFQAKPMMMCDPSFCAGGVPERGMVCLGAPPVPAGPIPPPQLQQHLPPAGRDVLTEVRCKGETSLLNGQTVILLWL